MTVRSLSFTPVQFLYLGLSWDTCQKSAVFQRKVSNLYPAHYKLAFAFSGLLYPLGNSAFLTVGLLIFR